MRGMYGQHVRHQFIFCSNLLVPAVPGGSAGRSCLRSWRRQAWTLKSVSSSAVSTSTFQRAVALERLTSEMPRTLHQMKALSFEPCTPNPET